MTLWLFMIVSTAASTCLLMRIGVSQRQHGARIDDDHLEFVAEMLEQRFHRVAAYACITCGSA